MLEKKEYANGQKVYLLEDEYLIYYFENGVEKAKGPFIEDRMEGEWLFYRKTGALWQVGHFKLNQKHGRWIRYDQKNQVEYDEDFNEGKIIKHK